MAIRERVFARMKEWMDRGGPPSEPVASMSVSNADVRSMFDTIVFIGPRDRRVPELAIAVDYGRLLKGACRPVCSALEGISLRHDEAEPRRQVDTRSIAMNLGDRGRQRGLR